MWSEYITRIITSFAKILSLVSVRGEAENRLASERQGFASDSAALFCDLNLPGGEKLHSTVSLLQEDMCAALKALVSRALAQYTSKSAVLHYDP